MIRTKISKMLGVDYPLIIAGQDSFDGGEPAVSAAKAGGIGLIKASAFAAPEDLKKELAAVRSLTRGAFGVSVDLAAEQAAGFIDTVAAAGARAVFTSGWNPGDWSLGLKKAGAAWVHSCPTLDQAIQAEKLGADAVVLAEPAAGGTSWDECTLMYLLPKAVEKLSIPIIAGGPINSGSGLIAAMALGAEGVQFDPLALSRPLTGALETIISEAVKVQKKLTQACLHALAQSSRVPDGITYVLPE